MAHYLELVLILHRCWKWAEGSFGHKNIFKQGRFRKLMSSRLAYSLLLLPCWDGNRLSLGFETVWYCSLWRTRGEWILNNRGHLPYCVHPNAMNYLKSLPCNATLGGIEQNRELQHCIQRSHSEDIRQQVLYWWEHPWLYTYSQQEIYSKLRGLLRRQRNQEFFRTSVSNLDIGKSLFWVLSQPPGKPAPITQYKAVPHLRHNQVLAVHGCDIHCLCPDSTGHGSVRGSHCSGGREMSFPLCSGKNEGSGGTHSRLCAPST